MLQRLDLAHPLAVTHPHHRQPPGRAGLPGPDPRQLGAAGRPCGVPLRPRGPLSSVLATFSSLIAAVRRLRSSTKRSSSSVRSYPNSASVPWRSLLACFRNPTSVAARLARSLSTFSRNVSPRVLAPWRCEFTVARAHLRLHVGSTAVHPTSGSARSAKLALRWSPSDAALAVVLRGRIRWQVKEHRCQIIRP